MENEKKSMMLADFVAKNIDKLKILEKISVSIFAIGLILFFLKQPDLKFVLIIGSLLAAICYFLHAYTMIDVENLETTGILNSIGFINFIYKLTYFSLSISSLAMLGLVIHLKRNNSLQFIGGFALVIILILSLITKINDRSQIYNTPFYTRVIVCLLLLSYLVSVQFNLL